MREIGMHHILRPKLLYRFRPFTADDLPVASQWLRTPEVIRWWGDPDEQLALLKEDLDQPLMRQWVVEFTEDSFAYAQAYPVDAWPQPHLGGLPAGAVAIDTFLGVPDMIGRGHGGVFIRLFAAMLVSEGAPVVAVDPDTRNQRARRAYRRAGFIDDRTYETADGSVALMLFRA